MPDFGHDSVASWAELLWTVVTSATFCVNLWAARDAYQDGRLLRKRHLNGTRSIQAAGNLRNELGRMYRSFLFSVVGFIFMTIPSFTPDGIVSLLATIIFISTVVIDLFLSIYDRWDRKEVLDLEEEKAMHAMEQVQRIEVLSQELAQAQEDTAGAQAQTAHVQEAAILAMAEAAALAQGELAGAQEAAAFSEGKAERSEEHAVRAEAELSASDSNRNKGG